MIEGQTVLVTGANRGLGQVLVEGLLARGANRVYAGMRRVEASPFADERVQPVELDVSKPDTFADLPLLMPDLTGLINNAAINLRGGILDARPGDFEQEMAVNYFGPVALIRSLCPVLTRNAPGFVTNILSICAFGGMPGLANYCASKAALFMAHQSLVTELADHGIAAFGVYPGPIDTDMNKGVEIELATPQSVVEAILAGMETGQRYIFPDPAAKAIEAKWLDDPRLIEAEFANYR